MESFLKNMFNATLGNILSLFTHNAHRQRGHSCACVGTDKYRKWWALALMFSKAHHVTGGRRGIQYVG